MREHVGAHRLAAHAVQHDGDAARFDQRAVAERLLCPQATHHHVSLERLDRADQVDGFARHRPDLAADAQRQDRADAGLGGDAHGDRVPQRAESGVADAALDQAAQHEGGVARGAAAGVVGAVGQHHRAAVQRQCLVERGVDVRVRRDELLTQAEKLVGESACECLRLVRIAIRVDEHLASHVGHVAPGEAVHEGDREHAVAALESLDPIDQAPPRLACRMDNADHARIGQRRHRPDAALRHGRAQVHELECAVQHVGVRILLERDQQVGKSHHVLAQVAVRVELGADHDLWADDAAHALEQVAFTVVIALRDHRAVQAEQHHVHRQRGVQVAQQFIAQRLVHRPRDDARRLRRGDHAFTQAPAVLRRTQPCGPERRGEELHLLRVLAGGEVTALLERHHAGGHGCECVRFGGERGAEDSHRAPSR